MGVRAGLAGVEGRAGRGGGQGRGSGKGRGRAGQVTGVDSPLPRM